MYSLQQELFMLRFYTIYTSVRIYLLSLGLLVSPGLLVSIDLLVSLVFLTQVFWSLHTSLDVLVSSDRSSTMMCYNGSASKLFQFSSSPTTQGHNSSSKSIKPYHCNTEQSTQLMQQTNKQCRKSSKNHGGIERQQ